MPGRPALLVCYLAATLAAFGGIYPRALPFIVLGAVLLALVSLRGNAAPARDTRALDLAIGILIAAIALQLIPLPAGIRAVLSPHAASVDALRPDAALREVAAAPLSVDPTATLRALALVAATALTYFAARRIFSAGGVRAACSALGWIASVAALGAIIQRALTPRLIYGIWEPETAGAIPFGPVVNRNHFAAWLLMVSALTAGYLIARISRRSDDYRGWRTLKRMIVSLAQSSVAWTAASWVIVTVTVVAAQSRSAAIGLLVALTTLTRGMSQSWRTVGLTLAAIALAAAALFVTGESTTTRIASRFATTLDASEIGRTVIWRETLPMVWDFKMTGVGAGAFGRAMLVYQETRLFVPHLGMPWYFNHAHSHYLQVAAEGGLLLLLPSAAIAILFVRLVVRRWREDRGELRAVRLGAAAGLLGVAVQSIWEVPLTMPAAALLAATLAAIATYRRPSTM